MRGTPASRRTRSARGARLLESSLRRCARPCVARRTPAARGRPGASSRAPPRPPGRRALGGGASRSVVRAHSRVRRRRRRNDASGVASRRATARSGPGVTASWAWWRFWRVERLRRRAPRGSSRGSATRGSLHTTRRRGRTPDEAAAHSRELPSMLAREPWNRPQCVSVETVAGEGAHCNFVQRHPAPEREVESEGLAGRADVGLDRPVPSCAPTARARRRRLVALIRAPAARARPHGLPFSGRLLARGRGARYFFGVHGDVVNSDFGSQRRWPLQGSAAFVF